MNEMGRIVRWWLLTVVHWGLWWFRWRATEPRPKRNVLPRKEDGTLAVRWENGRRIAT